MSEVSRRVSVSFSESTACLSNKFLQYTPYQQIVAVLLKIQIRRNKHHNKAIFRSGTIVRPRWAYESFQNSLTFMQLWKLLIIYKWIKVWRTFWIAVVGISGLIKGVSFASWSVKNHNWFSCKPKMPVRKKGVLKQLTKIITISQVPTQICLPCGAARLYWPTSHA